MATLTCPIPSNINPLSPNGFQFSISKLPEVNFFCQTVNIPGITLGAPEFGTPFMQTPIPGETLTYDTLNVQFLVDESMTNYQAIYNWIVALGFPQSYEQYTTFVSEDQRGIIGELAKNFSDGTLQILGSSNNPVKTIQFRDMFPIAIESLTFTSKSEDVQYMIAKAKYKIRY